MLGVNQWFTTDASGTTSAHQKVNAINNLCLNFSLFFFLSFSPLIITPLWWGSYPFRVSSRLGLFQSLLQLLHFWLSLIADIFVGCSVGCSVVQQSIMFPCTEEPIHLGYISLSSRVRVAIAFQFGQIGFAQRHILKDSKLRICGGFVTGSKNSPQKILAYC